MRLPKTINILGHKIKIVRKQLRSCMGKFVTRQLTIYLHPCNTSLMRETLLHEILHVIIWISRVGFTTLADEERFIHNLSPVLYQVLKDNKGLL